MVVLCSFVGKEKECPVNVRLQITELNGGLCARHLCVSDLVVGGVQQCVQVLQRGWGFVFESSQQAALDGSELDRPLRQQILVALGTDAQLAHKQTELAQQIQG